METVYVILPQKLGMKLREKAEEMDSQPEELGVELKYIVPKQKSYKIENPFSMWGWINARKLHPLCKGIEI